MARTAIITGFKGALVDPGGHGRVDEIFSIGLPKFSLVQIELIVDLPEGVDILPANAVGGGMGIKAGVAMVQHGPEHKPYLTLFDKIFNDLWLSA